MTTAYLSVIVLLPIAALVWASRQHGLHAFWSVVTDPQAVAALKLSIGAALIVAAVNAVIGTITAWVLVRDDFRGKSIVNALIDLPFALPTIVAGLVAARALRPAVAGRHRHRLHPHGDLLCAALRDAAVRRAHRAARPTRARPRDGGGAHSLGASESRVFWSIILPNILPGILSGVALAFARAVGEIGALVLISGNLPFKTEVASVFVFNQIQSGDRPALRQSRS